MPRVYIACEGAAAPLLRRAVELALDSVDPGDIPSLVGTVRRAAETRHRASQECGRYDPVFLPSDERAPYAQERSRPSTGYPGLLLGPHAVDLATNVAAWRYLNRW